MAFPFLNILTAMYLFHSFGLSSRSYTTDRKTDINGGSHSLEEQLCLQEDLSICNGDDICWDVGRHITSLCLDDRQGSQRSTAIVIVHLSCTFQQTGVEVEDISWVGLTTWGTTKQQRHLTISYSLQHRQGESASTYIHT